jgi:monoterpene epsilon-lactone hydrolase
MAARAFDLPGVSVTAMPRLAPLLRHRLLELGVALPWRVGGRLIAAELTRAETVADPAARLARYRALRDRVVRADARHMASLNVAIQGLSVERPVANGRAVSSIDGPGFRDDLILLYVPGGSFVVPRSPHFTAMVARIARAAGARTIVCDYRLAPEHPCPAAIDDVEVAADALMAQGHAPDAIVLVAESTGAGIALAAAQRLVARGMAPGGLAFLSPWIDCDPVREDLHPVARLCARLYLDGADPRDPARNPAYGSMRGLPPIAIHANRHDPMFADSEALARRAAAAGVSVELRWWPGRMHVLERHDHPDSRRSIEALAGFLNRCRRHSAAA